MAAKETETAQLALVQLDEAPRKRGRKKTGRHERALNRSLIAYELTGDKDAAGASLARALAAALDRAELNGDAFAAAQCAKPYRDVLLDLGVLVSSSSAVGALPADPFGFEGPTVPDDEDGAP